MRLTNLKQVRVFLAKVMKEVYENKLPADRARVLIYASSVLASVVKDGDLEQRMAEIEKQILEGK